jgi:phthiocerol/phenolphthiocerol synthesis type-I polyketide synthase E
VATATAGAGFARLGDDRFTVRPGEAADVEALLAAVGAGGPPPRLVWLDPMVAEGGGGADPAGLAAALVAVARALAAAAGSEPCHLVAVSDGLWEVAGEAVRAPERAAAEGLARVLPQELPGLACRWIDLWAEPADDAAADALATELATAGQATAELAAGGPAAAAAPPRVALRGGRRWTEAWEALAVPPPAPGGAGFRRGGRYLLTGGLGRFGTAVARHLGTAHRARLLLLDSREAGDGLDAEVVAEIHAAGGEVEVVRGDAGEAAAVAGALALAADRWGGLDGVLHAAGLPPAAFQPVADLGRADLAAHLAPKLGGLAALRAGLERLAAERPEAARPAFVLATSSLAPLLGGVGLGAFAAADAAMDAVCAASSRAALSRTAAAGATATAWTSVAWEVWEQGFGAAGGAVGQQQTALALVDEEVLAAVERAVTVARTPRLAVASGDLPARIAQWTRPLPPRRRAAVSGADRADVRLPDDPVERRIAEVWSEVLGVPRVGSADDFFLLGGDSLSGLQVLSKLRSELAVELPLQSFFEARTVAGMAAAVAAEQGRQAGEERRIEELLAEVEGLGDEEVEVLLSGEEGAPSEAGREVAR